MTKEKVEAVKFTDSPKHGGHQFIKGTVIGFKGAGVADYMVKCGWAEHSKAEPQHVYEAGEVEIDPDTIHTASGLKVKDIETTSGS